MGRTVASGARQLLFRAGGALMQLSDKFGAASCGDKDFIFNRGLRGERGERQCVYIRAAQQRLRAKLIRGQLAAVN